MRKTVLLAAPHRFGFTKMFVQNLEFHGYNVVDIGYSTDDFEYGSFKDRLVNSLKKTFLKDKTFKKELMYRQHKLSVQNKVKALGKKADYALIIRSDLYAKELIETIKQNSIKMIGYQWDGIDRYPDILSHIPMYDSFYVFDENDVKKYNEFNVKSITNFAFDFDDFDEVESKNQSFFFVGTHQPERVSQLNHVAKKLIQLGYNPAVYIYSDKPIEENTYDFPVQIINKMIDYGDALEKVKESAVLLDFKNNVHNGLSFRLFESLRYQKKIITDNESVKKYPFYQTSNIYLLSQEDKSIETFLKESYTPLQKEVIEPYTFKGWIDKVFH